MKKLAFINILIFSILTFSFANNDTSYFAYKGVLDLTNFDFSKNKTIQLSGEWEFYWHKLLTPDDFNPKKIIADAYAYVPRYWSSIKINGKKLPHTGFATYRLIIVSNKKVKNLKVVFPAVNSSMKVWWNGRLLGSSGVVGTSSSNSVPSIKTISREVSLDSPNVEVVVQISNFQHREGGFFESPRLGTIYSVTIWQNILLIISVLLIGAALIMSLYHLGLFLMQAKNLAALTFFVFALILALRLFITNNDLTYSVFPNISFDLKYRLEYFTFFFIPPLINWYFYQTLKDKLAQKATIVLLAIATLTSISLIFKPIVFTQIMPYYQIVYLLMIIIDTYIIFKNARLKTPGADILLGTYIIVFALVINDILYYLRVINTVQLSPVAIFILILGQSLVLARIFSQAFKINLELKKELEYKNLNLEKIVRKRTRLLELQKQQLEEQNLTLQRQTQQLKEKDELITSSLKYAAAMLQAIMPDPSMLNKYFDNFLLFLPKDIVSGDGYWFTDKTPDYLFVVVYDCTGHGVPAAFLSVVVNYLFKNLIFESQILEPNKILEQIDQKLKVFLQRQSRDGMEAAIVRIEKNTQEPQIKFATARLEIYYYNSRTRLVTRHKGTRRALGYSSSEHNPEVFSNFLITFKTNDAIYLTTDGYINQTNKANKRFGSENFIDLIIKIGDKPMWEQRQIIHETLVDFMGDTPQRDDILILGLKNSPYQSHSKF